MMVCSHTAMLCRSLGLGLVLLAATSACKDPQPKIPPAAVIRALEGQVSVKTNEQAEALAAKVEQALLEGNIIATGGDGRATIEFNGGNRVDLQSDTTLVVRAAGGSAAQFGAVLLTGKAKASSTGQGVLLAIGTPFGLTEVGGSSTTLELSVTDGLTVLVGEVVLTSADGNRTTVKAGSTVTLEGLIAPIGATKSDTLTLEPMEFVLLANPKQVQIRHKGDKEWRTPKKRDVLTAGDAIRTRKATGTQLQFGDAGEVELGSKAELTVNDAAQNSKNQRAKYTLASGNALINLKALDKKNAKHDIEVAGMTVTIEPGLKEAQVEVNAQENNRAQVTVRFGRVALSDGTVVDAGSTVNIEGGKVTVAPRPLATTLLDLKPKSSAVVYYQTDVPAIEFSWKAEENAKDYEFEVSSDKNFTTPVFRETVKRPAFVYDQFQPGRYFWRVKGSGDWDRGALTIQKRKETDCSNCKRLNVIDDTGEKTVVYYQKALPAITLRWTAVEGASKYQLKVYPDGEFDNPLVDRSVTETQVAFPEGQFDEGKYYWHMQAQSDAGKDLATGKMNTLQIAYDNAIVDLSIKTPKQSQKVTTKSLATKGEVQLGASLSINGKKVSLDENGRFSVNLDLNKGLNEIVYRTVSTDGIERYYVRQVIRR